MRRYMTALLILSVYHLALAAPVNIGEMLEVRSNAVDAPKGGIAAWEKRADSDNEMGHYWSTICVSALCEFPVSVFILQQMPRPYYRNERWTTRLTGPANRIMGVPAIGNRTHSFRLPG
jgi:hypothetical protein